MKSQTGVTFSHPSQFFQTFAANLPAVISDLRAGKIVTIPTETVDGYAVLLHSPTAVKSLMALKDRDYDSGKIFTLVPESKSTISKYALISPLAAQLIDRFLPGELTLILPKNPNFHHFYFDEFARRGKITGIGIRLPSAPFFAELLAASGPLLLTSANPRGGTPVSHTGHLPSTIVSLANEQPQILRRGNLVIDPYL